MLIIKDLVLVLQTMDQVFKHQNFNPVIHQHLNVKHQSIKKIKKRIVKLINQLTEEDLKIFSLNRSEPKDKITHNYILRLMIFQSW